MAEIRVYVGHTLDSLYDVKFFSALLYSAVYYFHYFIKQYLSAHASNVLSPRAFEFIYAYYKKLIFLKVRISKQYLNSKHQIWAIIDMA